jgi:protein-S-isoprenylcysteine O-methyltransferase Ste14
MSSPSRPAVPHRVVTVASAIFFLLGPGLEAGVGPWLVTGGWNRGDDLPAQSLWTVAGTVLVIAGVAVLVQSFAGFVRDGRGTPTPAVPTDRLVVSGAYRHVRNPMYVATAAVIVGEGLLLARPVLFAAALAYLATLAFCGRRWEEPRLRERFGPSYDAYREAVPGWWPRLRPWTG